MGVIQFFVMAVLGLMACSTEAAVEWQPGKTVELPGKALDLAVSVDGRRTFVLHPEGRVTVLGQEGRIESRLETGLSADRLALSPDGSRLYLNDISESRLQELKLEYVYAVGDGNAPFRGRADAPVTVVVFSEFQCPHCAKLEPVLSEVLSRYPEKVKVVFRQFPLRSHKYARHAAIAALAAHRQGKFWLLHDLLFANQENLSPQLIQDLAVRAGVDPERYQRDMMTEGVIAQLESDIGAAQDAGVRGTPSVFINGRLLLDRSIESFVDAIERAQKDPGQ